MLLFNLTKNKTLMTSHPGPKRQVEKEWEKAAIEVSEKLGVPFNKDSADADELFKTIKEKDADTNQLMWDYLNAYEEYIMFLKKLSEENAPAFFRLEDDMNDKRRAFYKHLYGK
jgi:hypothetical protein